MRLRGIVRHENTAPGSLDVEQLDPFDRLFWEEIYAKGFEFENVHQMLEAADRADPGAASVASPREVFGRAGEHEIGLGVARTTMVRGGPGRVQKDVVAPPLAVPYEAVAKAWLTDQGQRCLQIDGSSFFA